MVKSHRNGEFLAGSCPHGQTSRSDYYILRDAIEKRKIATSVGLELENVAEYWGKRTEDILALGSTFSYFDLNVKTGDKRVDRLW